MTLFSTAQNIARGPRRDLRGHMIAIMLAGAATASAIALVAYLLWPTWGPDPASSPAPLPGSIGATPFYLPTPAVRTQITPLSAPQVPTQRTFAYSITPTVH